MQQASQFDPVEALSCEYGFRLAQPMFAPINFQLSSIDMPESYVRSANVVNENGPDLRPIDKSIAAERLKVFVCSARRIVGHVLYGGLRIADCLLSIAL